MIPAVEAVPFEMKPPVSIGVQSDKPHVANLIKIGIDEKGQVYVAGDLDKKELCLMAISEAIKVITLHKVAKEKPKTTVEKIGHGIMNFVRGKP